MMVSRLGTGKIWVCLVFLIPLVLSGCRGQALAPVFDPEAVEQSAREVVLMLNQQDSAGLLALSDDRLAEVLTQDVMADIYDALAEGGAFEEFGQVRVSGMTDEASGGDFAVVVLVAKYQNRSFVFTISFNEQMELAGLYYR